MSHRSLLEEIPDRRRVCVLLRADGWSYEEIGAFLNIGVRLVRYELEKASSSFPGVLDHRREENKNRLFRLVYLLGVSDAGGDPSEYCDYLDGLEQQASWVRMRMRAHDKMVEDLEARRRSYGKSDAVS